MSTAVEQHRPWWIRSVNRWGTVLSRLTQVDLSLETADLLQAAERKTGLDDFGNASFMEGLERLTRSLQTEADLNFVGQLSTRTYLLQLLVNRLLLVRDRQQYPQIAQQEIVRPLIITGLPRTGSTMLFELMSQDDGFRIPLSWEVMLPSPPPQESRWQTDPRIKQTERMLARVDRIAPRFRQIHPLGTLLPQECIAITAHAFKSIQFHTTNNVPGYQRWLDDVDQQDAYEFHHSFLQQLQAFSPKGRWLLKAPGHMFGIEALVAIYPDAQIVQMHRDLVAVAGSIASHCASLRQAFSEDLDLREIGRSWCELWTKGLARLEKFRASHPQLESRFLDVDYAELMRDPLLEIRRIYEFAGLKLTENTRQQIEAYRKAHPKNRHGRHRYDLDQYGLDAASVHAMLEKARAESS